MNSCENIKLLSTRKEKNSQTKIIFTQTDLHNGPTKGVETIMRSHLARFNRRNSPFNERATCCVFVCRECECDTWKMSSIVREMRTRLEPAIDGYDTMDTSSVIKKTDFACIQLNVSPRWQFQILIYRRPARLSEHPRPETAAVPFVRSQINPCLVRAKIVNLIYRKIGTE